LFFRSTAASAASRTQSQPPGRGVTRRRLLATGGVAGAAAITGFRPWAAEAAPAPDTPSYLLRSSYATLSTKSFTSSYLGRASDLTLNAVADLAGLKGNEDAFALEFSAKAPLAPGIHTFSHPNLGVFDLFIAPVERQGGYEVVVNRSVGAPKHVPKPPRANPGPVAPPKEPPKPAPHARKPRVRRLAARRMARGVVAEIDFNGSVHLKSVSAWLLRGGTVVAAVSVRNVRGKRKAIKLPTRKRPRGGRYELIVATKDRSGREEFRSRKIVLQ
jgi:uncharacterized protein DUF6916